MIGVKSYSFVSVYPLFIERVLVGWSINTSTLHLRPWDRVSWSNCNSKESVVLFNGTSCLFERCLLLPIYVSQIQFPLFLLYRSTLIIFWDNYKFSFLSWESMNLTLFYLRFRYFQRIIPFNESTVFRLFVENILNLSFSTTEFFSFLF